MRRIGTVVVTLSATLGGLAACASGEDEAAAPTAVVEAAPDTSPTSTTSTTSTSTTSTTSSTTSTTTTTTAPPTTLPPLPIPAPAPPEDGSSEPRVELGSIEIPKLGLSRPMFEGIRLTTLDRGPGHWPGTAMPGEVGNVVVAGHRVSHNEDFRNLDQLEPGDEVIFNTASGRHTYHVLSTEVVGPEAIWIVDQTPAATGTLFACHPPGSTRQRIVVHLELAA
jgi:sortase A